MRPFGVFGNQNITFWCQERITIGRRVAISWNVDIMDSNFHEIAGVRTTAPVTIEDRVLIGCGSRILPGVTIGHGQLPTSPLVVGIVLRTLRGPAPASPGPADCRSLLSLGSE